MEEHVTRYGMRARSARSGIKRSIWRQDGRVCDGCACRVCMYRALNMKRSFGTLSYEDIQTNASKPRAHESLYDWLP